MSSTQQFLLFCLVGVATTVLDFLVFNLLSRPRVGWRRIPANLVSVTTAMTWSFLANWLIVFNPNGPAWLERAGRFLVTTLFSAFILQNLVLYITTDIWKGPANAAVRLARRLRPKRPVSEDMISRNTCKAMAVSAGLIWNFCWYKFFVYTN